MPENANSIAAFKSCDVEAVVQDEVKLAISRYQRQASPRDPFGRTTWCGENGIILYAEF